MEGKSRFTPKQVNKALRLLRELPVKDGRKSIRETLRALEDGMRDALEKGYSRGEIQETIAEAEVMISATTLKGFLAGEQKNGGQKPHKETARESTNISQSTGGGLSEKTERGGHKPDSQAVGRPEHADQKLAEDLAGKVSPGSIVIKPDTPKEEL